MPLLLEHFPAPEAAAAGGFLTGGISTDATTCP